MNLLNNNLLQIIRAYGIGLVPNNLPWPIREQLCDIVVCEFIVIGECHCRRHINKSWLVDSHTYTQTSYCDE